MNRLSNRSFWLALLLLGITLFSGCATLPACQDDYEDDYYFIEDR